jgi:hypothetical protein
MGFLSLLVLLGLSYLVWRISDQLPDLIFRLSEIQRDIAEIRRRLASSDGSAPSEAAAAAASDTQRSTQPQDLPR